MSFLHDPDHGLQLVSTKCQPRNQGRKAYDTSIYILAFEKVEDSPVN
ncbi:MAG TPA: hypothetical protein VH796_08265 [Nitrososphaeraceae archaeon]